MTTLLVIAKAPVAGLAKTRLAPDFGSVHAARIAAASLLDTLDAVYKTPARRRVVALTGDLSAAENADEVRRSLARFTIIDQRGDGFGTRLANAHLDAAQFGDGSVIQIGMDTPQVTPALLKAAAAATESGTACLGRAHDGGWWLLGLADPTAAKVLAEVPMSTAETGALTAAALVAAGLVVRDIPTMSDVDTAADAYRVAELCGSHSRFRHAVVTASLAKGA